MRVALVLIGIGFALTVVSPSTRAQSGYYGNDGYGGQTIRCESRDGRTERCDTGGAYAQLVRQLSSSACTRDRTWGNDSYGVWVSDGCRAEFRLGSNSGYGYNDGYGYNNGYGNDGYNNGYGSYGNNSTIRCESRDNRSQRCDTGGRYASLIRQLSSTPCDEGRTWGNDSRGVWVSGGCRADFQLDRRDYGYDNGYSSGGNGVVRCESRDNRSVECPIASSRRSDVRLIRQLSSTPCTEGDTWGRSGRGVWVTRGCRGEFVATRGSGSWGSPGPNGGGSWGGNDSQSIRCESNDQRTIRCNVPIYHRAQLVRQLSSSPCSEGGSWGWDRDGIWVSRGCRAQFQVW